MIAFDCEPVNRAKGGCVFTFGFYLLRIREWEKIGFFAAGENA